MSDPTSSSRDGHASGSHYQPSLSVVFIIVVLFVGATFLMVRAVTPSSGTPTTTTTAASSSTSTTAPHSGRVIKSHVRVQVANGTTTGSLASRYTQKLMTQNWDTLPPVNGPHVAATIIYYNPGDHAAALLVAAAVGVTAAVVHPLGGGSPVPGASGDGVIVILGPNSVG